VQPADGINLGPEYQWSHFYFHLHRFCQKWSFQNIKSHVTNINLSTSWNPANIKSYQIRQADVTPIKIFGIICLAEFFSPSLELSPLNGIFHKLLIMGVWLIDVLKRT
jgi:hypothetical protein